MLGNRKRAEFETSRGRGRLDSATKAGVVACVLVAGLPTVLSAQPAAAQVGRTCLGLPATIVGTSAGERIDGTPGNDVIVGGAGADQIFGFGGNDVICGGLGSNLVDGGAGNDRIVGGPVRDVLRGGTGNDVIRGGSGNDRIRGDVGLDRLFGGNGNDYVLGGDGVDAVNGGAGADLLLGGADGDTMAGNAGNDRLFGGPGADRLVGGDGVDFLNAGLGDDIVRGGAGNDRLIGWTGADRLFGDAGNDIIAGGAAADMLTGGNGADVLDGGSEVDVCTDNGSDTTRRNCEPQQFDVDLNLETLTVDAAQEDGIFSDGDEPYVAVIEWRAVPGEAGSTRTEYKGNLADLSFGAFAGEVLPVPASVGSADFDNVQFVANLSEVAAGDSPELIGTVMVTMESDATPSSTVDNVMLDVKAAVSEEVASLIEPMDLTGVTDSTELATELATAVDAIQLETTNAVGQALSVWFASFADPDDLVGVAYEAWAGANGSLGTELDAPFQTALAAFGANGGTLRNDETREVTVTGNDATYTLATRTKFE